jgi:hypothetical protein
MERLPLELLRRSAAAAIWLVALAAPGVAGAWEVRIVVDAQGRLDASYTLIDPCPPDIYFCGTEESEPVEDAQYQVDTGTLVNPVAPVTRSATVPAVSASGPYGAGATAVAEPGSLRALAGAGAAGTPYRLSWLNEFEEEEFLDFFRQASAGAQANVSLSDPITFHGPAGTTGTFNLVLTFDRSFGVIGSGGGAASAQSYVFDPNGIVPALASASISDCSNCNNAQQTVSVAFQAAAGSTWALGQQLNGVTANATTSPGNPTSQITTDVGNTLSTSLEIVTPGFSITSDSGHDYVSAPEPGATALALCAVCALAARGKSRA